MIEIYAFVGIFLLLSLICIYVYIKILRVLRDRAEERAAQAESQLEILNDRNKHDDAIADEVEKLRQAQQIRHRQDIENARKGKRDAFDTDW